MFFLFDFENIIKVLGYSIGISLSWIGWKMFLIGCYLRLNMLDLGKCIVNFYLDYGRFFLKEMDLFLLLVVRSWKWVGIYWRRVGRVFFGIGSLFDFSYEWVGIFIGRGWVFFNIEKFMGIRKDDFGWWFLNGFLDSSYELFDVVYYF